jgi:hypothetical protein
MGNVATNYLSPVQVKTRIKLNNSPAIKQPEARNVSAVSILFPPSNGVTAPNGPGPPHYRRFRITFRHTTRGRTPLDE